MRRVERVAGDTTRVVATAGANARRAATITGEADAEADAAADAAALGRTPAGGDAEGGTARAGAVGEARREETRAR